jgi:hypothetical protein
MERTPTAARRKPSRKPLKRAMTSRTATVTSWDSGVFLSAERRAGQTSLRTLTSISVSGTLSAPIGNVTDFELTVFPTNEPTVGKGEIPSVGSIISTKPVVNAVIHLADQEFQTVLALAAASRLASVRLYLQEPRYGSGLIASISISTRPPEEE